MNFISLICKQRQVIPPNTYTELRFDEESIDGPNWHANTDLSSRDSALIIPQINAVARLDAMIHWESADAMAVPPTQYYARISRDPFGNIDSTATNDRAATTGKNMSVFGWTQKIYIGQPLAIMVAHNGVGLLGVVLAEFKVHVP